MEELKMGDAVTKDMFCRFFKDDNLVPILGAGFTAGMPARSGNCVVSGSTLKQYMMHMIRQEIRRKMLQMLQKEIYLQ